MILVRVPVSLPSYIIYVSSEALPRPLSFELSVLVKEFRGELGESVNRFHVPIGDILPPILLEFGAVYLGEPPLDPPGLNDRPASMAEYSYLIKIPNEGDGDKDIEVALPDLHGCFRQRLIRARLKVPIEPCLPALVEYDAPAFRGNVNLAEEIIRIIGHTLAPIPEEILGRGIDGILDKECRFPDALRTAPYRPKIEIVSEELALELAKRLMVVR